jgi:hypothetical protein
VNKKYVLSLIVVVLTSQVVSGIGSSKQEEPLDAVITALPDPCNNNKINYQYSCGEYCVIVGSVRFFANGKENREINVPRELFEAFPIEHQLAVLKALDLMGQERVQV